MVERQPKAHSIPALQGLRGVAALWVLVYHIGTRAGPIGVSQLFSNGFVSHGWFAVDVFFVLSGFVLMRTYGSTFQAISRAALLQFAAQRLVRVYPLATVVLLAIAILVLADPGFVAYRRQLGSPADFSCWPFFQTLLLATRWLPPFRGSWNEPVWSLSAELVGYALFPVLASTLLKLPRPNVVLLHAVACIGLLIGMEVVFDKIDRNDIFNWALARAIYAFAAGVALARLHALVSGRDEGLAGTLTATALLMAALACRGGWWAILELPAAAMMVYGLACGPSLVADALSTRVALWLGSISFPLYLLHVIPLFWLEYRVVAGPVRGPEVWAALAIYVAGCLAAAQVLHTFIERPTAELARRIGRRRAVGARLVEAGPLMKGSVPIGR